jgi:hypothetical protein
MLHLLGRHPRRRRQRKSWVYAQPSFTLLYAADAAWNSAVRYMQSTVWSPGAGTGTCAGTSPQYFFSCTGTRTGAADVLTI